MERRNLTTGGAANLIQPLDKVRQIKRRNLATGQVANLMQLMTGRANELWIVVDLVALMFSLEPPTQADNRISVTDH
ncbi:MAG TPA: hypothetical protein VIE89_14905 [Candidatus Binatia bacterium]|jgi:hypothetical protein